MMPVLLRIRNIHFHQAPSFLFYYKIAGKGVVYKMMDNAKNVIGSGNNINITKFENKPGGLVEGSFSFTDIAFENNYGQIAARVKAITNGSFRTTINDDIVIGKSAKQNNNSLDNENEQLNEETSLVFKSLEPTSIMKKIFKPIDQNGDGYYRWKPNLKEVSDFDSSISDDGFMYTNYDTVLFYNDSIDKVLMFFTTVVYQNGQLMDCHACGAVMSCASFSKQPDGTYGLNKLDTVLQTNTEWGKPNPVELIKIGTNKYAVSATSYDMHQGYEQAQITYFNAENLNVIFEDQILDDNTGAALEKGYSNETKIKFLPAVNGSEYFILQAITTGTEDNGYGKIKSINKKEAYYFDVKKGGYVLQPKAAAVK